MKVAITGGTGFVGRHLAAELAALGHEVVLVARNVDQRPGSHDILNNDLVSLEVASVSDRASLVSAFATCDAVAHCAGINREIGPQTYDAVHVEGTRNVVEAAESAGVSKLSLLSFLRARPNSGSDYHDTKWQAEEIVRASNLDWTVLKPGMIYGQGDHMLDHLSHALHTFHMYLGLGDKQVRPLAVSDLVRVLVGALTTDDLSRKTVPVVGPTTLKFDDAVRIVADEIGVRVLWLRAPSFVHHGLACVSEATMRVPLVAQAQVRILAEGPDATCAPDALPIHLHPQIEFAAEAIRSGLPPKGRFGLSDLRWPAAS